MGSTARISPGEPAAAVDDSLRQLAARYRRVRQQTMELAEPLSAEDCQVQSMPDASPVKWHLAHTSWFFETFVLEPVAPGYRPFHPQFRVLFNSYYNSVGEQHPRPERGVLSRPNLAEIVRYRAHVDERILSLLEAGTPEVRSVAATLELGLHHEQQHQELILTDIKHAFSCNRLHPAYRSGAAGTRAAAPVALSWVPFAGGVHPIGHAGGGFAFDNEGPRHEVLVRPFTLASRATTTGEYTAFMQDGGYERPELWLSDGWTTLQRQGWRAPLYWERVDGEWYVMTLAGLRRLGPDEPVCHVSLYEADAFARWKGCRLATEAEWEVAARDVPLEGNFLESGSLHPVPAAAGRSPVQMFGDVWEWTQSAYAPYPGYRAAAGALGEYNGKFMCNQIVLRGGSCATPATHMRSTYRNFFPPNARWQFSGIRLARDGD